MTSSGEGVIPASFFDVPFDLAGPSSISYDSTQSFGNGQMPYYMPPDAQLPQQGSLLPALPMVESDNNYAQNHMSAQMPMAAFDPNSATMQASTDQTASSSALPAATPKPKKQSKPKTESGEPKPKKQKKRKDAGSEAPEDTANSAPTKSKKTSKKSADKAKDDVKEEDKGQDIGMEAGKGRESGKGKGKGKGKKQAKKDEATDTSPDKETGKSKQSEKRKAGGAAGSKGAKGAKASSAAARSVSRMSSVGRDKTTPGLARMESQRPQDGDPEEEEAPPPRAAGDEEQDDENEEAEADDGVEELGKDHFSTQEAIYAAQQRNMGLLSMVMDDDQLDRHMASRRGALNKTSVRKLVNHVLSQSVSQHVAMVVSGVAKIFVGEIVEKARQIQTSRGDQGPLKPTHLREAHRQYYMQRERPGHYPPGTNTGFAGQGKRRRMF
ncbi:TAFII28-domain-containing protein [Testicularia cyperi]|uniref:Transcription initiation factor TFIID subunit 11 n=1 Tax=Testicularia cyperi TaxID=1882483 RepID=A0A317XTR0_9BASI|nr:TAFII28-domain-containing protein [Testicularia cyperi]